MGHDPKMRQWDAHAPQKSPRAYGEAKNLEKYGFEKKRARSVRNLGFASFYLYEGISETTL
jgi:hypothetical protein